MQPQSNLQQPYIKVTGSLYVCLYQSISITAEPKRFLFTVKLLISSGKVYSFFFPFLLRNEKNGWVELNLPPPKASLGVAAIKKTACYDSFKTIKNVKIFFYKTGQFLSKEIFVHL